MNYESSLYHHGILGMKWGVRRYQNKDGSLTPAGMRRYGVAGHTYEEYQADRKYMKKHGLTADVVGDKKNGITGVQKLHNNRTGKELSLDYAQALLSGKAYMPSDSNKSASYKTATNTLSEKESRKQRKAISKGRAAINGVLRQIGFSATAGAASQVVGRLGYETVASYGGMALQTLGTLTNVGYTIYDVARSGKIKNE